MFLKKLYLIFKFLIRKLDLFVGGSYLHKIYDYFYNPNMFILDKKHQRKIVLFYNQNNDLLSKLSSTYNTDKGSIEKIKTNKNKFGYETHTYTDFYSLLFGSFRENIKLVFECGILNGSSLRVWRDYFVNSEIFGGDINKELLFTEHRIKTFYVDQTSKNSIKQMWLNVQKNNFDLIIDDGLHTNDANITFFSESFKFLKPNGIYIIEDVSNDNLLSLINYFSNYNFQAIVLKSKEVRYANNNLIMITK
jgi:SAM-dependent methyltransferase